MSDSISDPAVKIVTDVASGGLADTAKVLGTLTGAGGTSAVQIMSTDAVRAQVFTVATGTITDPSDLVSTGAGTLQTALAFIASGLVYYEHSDGSKWYYWWDTRAKVLSPLNTPEVGCSTFVSTCADLVAALGAGDNVVVIGDLLVDESLEVPEGQSIDLSCGRLLIDEQDIAITSVVAGTFTSVGHPLKDGDNVSVYAPGVGGALPTNIDPIVANGKRNLYSVINSAADTFQLEEFPLGGGAVAANGGTNVRVVTRHKVLLNGSLVAPDDKWVFAKADGSSTRPRMVEGLFAGRTRRPEWFGARGAGVTDDRDAIQSACMAGVWMSDTGTVYRMDIEPEIQLTGDYDIYGLLDLRVLQCHVRGPNNSGATITARSPWQEIVDEGGPDETPGRYDTKATLDGNTGGSGRVTVFPGVAAGNTVTLKGHPFVPDDYVELSYTLGTTPQEDTTVGAGFYYVVAWTETTFQISLTKGGPPVVFDGNGSPATFEASTTLPMIIICTNEGIGNPDNWSAAYNTKLERFKLDANSAAQSCIISPGQVGEGTRIEVDMTNFSHFGFAMPRYSGTGSGAFNQTNGLLLQHVRISSNFVNSNQNRTIGAAVGGNHPVVEDISFKGGQATLPNDMRCGIMYTGKFGRITGCHFENTGYGVIVADANDFYGGTFQDLDCNEPMHACVRIEGGRRNAGQAFGSLVCTNIAAEGRTIAETYVAGAPPVVGPPAAGTSILSPGHPFENNQRIQFVTDGEVGSSLDSEIIPDYDYYVVDKTTDTFGLAHSIGGVPISFVGDGVGPHTMIKRCFTIEDVGIISDNPTNWVVGTNYAANVGEYRETPTGDFYYLHTGHVSSAADEPGVGENWQDYWYKAYTTKTDPTLVRSEGVGYTQTSQSTWMTPIYIRANVEDAGASTANDQQTFAPFDGHGWDHTGDQVRANLAIGGLAPITDASEAHTLNDASLADLRATTEAALDTLGTRYNELKQANEIWGVLKK